MQVGLLAAFSLVLVAEASAQATGQTGHSIFNTFQAAASTIFSAGGLFDERRPLIRTATRSDNTTLGSSSLLEEEQDHCGFAAWSAWSDCTGRCSKGRRVRSREALGLRAEFFSSSLSETPAVVRADKTVSLDGPDTDFKDHGAARWTGKILVEQAGRYTFALGDGAGHSRLKVGSTILFNKQGSAPAKPARALLAKGLHAVNLEISGQLHGRGELRYSGPDTGHKLKTVPSSVLRHDITRSECKGSALQTETCLVDGCSVDCKWGFWGEWTSCSKSCSGGVMQRHRTVEILARFGGKACESQGGEADVQKQACNSRPCHEPLVRK